MNKNIITGVLIALVFFIVGVLAKKYIFPDKKVDLVNIDNASGTINTEAPDTIKVYLTDPELIQENADLKKALKKRPNVIKEVVYDTIYPIMPVGGAISDEEIESMGVRVYESYLDVRYDQDLKILTKQSPEFYLREQIWAYGSAPVDSFSTMPTVMWDKYYNEFVVPKVTEHVVASENRMLFQGAIGSGVIAAGLYSNNWYIALPAMGVGASLILNWITLPF